MERRSALKNMGMAFGYAVATPTLLSLLQSCKDKPSYAEWVPSFLSKEQAQALALTLDVILPKTDTPSATEVNVHTFIDSYMDEVMPLEQRDFTMMKMEKFYNKALENSGKENLVELEAEDIDSVLTTYLRKRTDEEEDAHREAVMNYFQTIQQGGEATLDSEVACYTFANELRDLAIWVYKSSESVAEETLAYLPIPGEYVACVDVQELTGGKAWSE